MTPSEIISFISTAAALVAILIALRKSKPEANKLSAEARKANADADNTITDTATDTVALVRQVYEARVAWLEKQVSELQSERESYQVMVRELNSRLGEVMRAAEIQSREISTLRDRVDELLSILREAGVEWPQWAGVKNGK